MSHQSHAKLTIAVAQLETALRLFDEGSEYYSVITLAGAADEIFGRMLEAKGGVSALVSLTQAAASIHVIVGGDPGTKRKYIERANLARNALKHLSPGGDPVVGLDMQQEAIDMLDRAISNYFALTHQMSQAMDTFERARRAT